MDIFRFLKDFSIPYRTQGHKHCRSGWAQIRCPFCTGNPGWHLGYCYDKKQVFYGRFVCYRCGGKGVFRVVERLTGLHSDDIKALLKQYGGAVPYIPRPDRAEQQRTRLLPFKFPSLTQDGLGNRAHLKYLRERNFDPDTLVRQHDLKHTGPVADLDKIDFSWRVVVPIMSGRGDVISFQARDVLNISSLKYIACPMARERFHYKHVLYGLDKVSSLMDVAVAVEGVFDQWRLGPPALGAFGINLIIPQLRVLSQFKRVIVLFDPDPQAGAQAKQIKSRLEWQGTEVVIEKDFLRDGRDPAELTDQEAREIMRDITKRVY
jgi:hypothetical protein